MKVKELLDKYTKQAEKYEEERDTLLAVLEDGSTELDDQLRFDQCDVLYNKCLEIVQDLRKVV